jgi:hypothetical protein
MTDRDPGETGEDLPFGQELISFVEEQKFGTPEFRAVSDCLQLGRLRHTWGDSFRDVAKNKNNPAIGISDESDLRIVEQKIALLEHQIYLGESQLEGYSSAFTHMDNELQNDLAIAANQEGHKKFPSDPNAAAAHSGDLYDDAVEKIEDIVYRKMKGTKPSE